MPRLLLLKLGAIGDVIMVLPAAQLMHASGFEIDWVCGEVMAPLLALYPWIRVLPVDEPALVRSGKLTSLVAITRLWAKLARLGRFDLSATLYYDRRYRVLTWPVRAARKLWLSRGDRAFSVLPGRRYADEYARILTGRADTELPLQLPPLAIPEGAARLCPALVSLAAGRPRVVLVPGGARNLLRDDALRRWPVERYVELGRQLLDRGAEVVLLGGPGDTWAAEAFGSLPVLDLIGKLSLLESVGLLDSAEITVTHDTGPLHMAGMTRTAIVALFGPTSPYSFCPQRENVIALWGGEGFACRPCYDGRDFAPCPHNGCMEQISVETVLRAVERLSLARRDGQSLPPRVEVPQPAPQQTGVVTIADLVASR